MAETAFAVRNEIAQEAFKMLFALDECGSGTGLSGPGRLPVEARSSLEAERLELLECVHQELGRASQAGSGRPGREVCADLLAHLAGCSMGELAATIH